MLLRTGVFLGLLASLSACAERGDGPIVSTGRRYTAATNAITDYTLGVGDKIRVTVYNEPSLTGEFWVNPDGAIALPLIGSIPVLGKPVAQVAEEARAQFADGYLRDPKVAAEVVAFRPFYILGEVAAPGQYPYATGLTAFNAIATAKGFTPRADRAVIHIRRQGGEAEVNYRLTPELIVRPGDTIRVGERFF